MGNPYSRVIQELQLNQNWRGIVFAIAQFAPSAVIRAIDENAKKDEPAWMKECREMYKRGDKIPAIKFWREQTGDGLKQAVDGVKAL